jgi:hypothetical protein
MSQVMRRRSFVAISVKAAAGAYSFVQIGPKLFASELLQRSSDSEFAYLCGHSTGNRYEPDSQKHFLALRYLHRNDSILIPIGTDVHSVLQNPLSPLSVLTIPKNQSVGTYIPNLREPDQQIKMSAAKDLIFSGHGLFIEEHKILLTSETDPLFQTGKLVIRDSSSLKIIDIIDSGGRFPHEIRLVDGIRIAVANGGTGPNGSNLTVMDIKNRTVMETHIPVKSGIGVRHFAIDKDKNLIVGTWTNSAPINGDESGAEILFNQIGHSPELKLTRIDATHKTHFRSSPSQFLSVDLNLRTNLVVLTASGADVVIVVQPDPHKILKVLKKTNPTGVSSCLDARYMAVTDASGCIEFLDMSTLEWDPKLTLNNTHLNGAHLSLLKLR